MTTHVPPGWTDWHVAGNGYASSTTSSTRTHRRALRRWSAAGRECANYLTDVLSARAMAFIDRAATAHRPFVMEVATFAPHFPYTPAPRNATDFPGLSAPSDPSFNTQNINPPDWLGHRKSLTPAQMAQIDTEFRMRAQAVEGVDRLLAQVEAELAARGLARNTYIVFSSDNGYHMGEHRLLPRQADRVRHRHPRSSDHRRSRRPQGRIVAKVVQNTDLYPTFVQIAGRRPSPAIDGHSLMPLLHPPQGHIPALADDRADRASRTHRHPRHRRRERRGGRRPSSLRGDRAIEPAVGEHRLRRIQRTGNTSTTTSTGIPSSGTTHTSPSARASGRSYTSILVGLEHCHGTTACWFAADPQ